MDSHSGLNMEKICHNSKKIIKALGRNQFGFSKLPIYILFSDYEQLALIFIHAPMNKKN